MSNVRPTKILKHLFMLAQDVAPVSRARIVAALVYKNKIISYGTNVNKTHPMAAKYCKHPEAQFLHAEPACIKNALRTYDMSIISKSTLYIARAKLDREFEFVVGMAKPCKGCEGAIKAFNIKKVVYTTDMPAHIGIAYF